MRHSVQSEHRGLFIIKFHTHLLFGNDRQPLGLAAFCDFIAKCPTDNSKYIAAKHSHLTEQGFFTHLATLQSLPNGNHHLAKCLDTNLQAAAEAASKQVKRHYHPWWSLAIAKAPANIDILLCLQSSLWTNTDVSAVLLMRLEEIGSNMILPTTLPSCQALLHTKTLVL
jgi:hypothetical protein